MSDYIYLFDLDSTITKEEILPKLAKKLGKEKEMRELTESTMIGEIPFKESFLKRVDILKELPVSKVQNVIEEIELNDMIVKFIQENRDKCYVVTGNLDIWIEKLLKKIGLENNCYCSKAYASKDHLTAVVSVIDKSLICEQFVQKYVAIGDGNNDADMIKKASIGIGFGGVRPIALSLLENADYAFYSQNKLYEFLTKINEEKV